MVESYSNGNCPKCQYPNACTTYMHTYCVNIHCENFDLDQYEAWVQDRKEQEEQREKQEMMELAEKQNNDDNRDEERFSDLYDYDFWCNVDFYGMGS